MKTKIIYFVFISIICFNTFSQTKYFEKGIASYYHDYLKNKTTANGEIYNPEELTAAHLTLPFNSIVSVTNLKNNKTINVRINDRGPFIEKRIIDLSKAAADSLDFIYQGLTNVIVKVIKVGKTEFEQKKLPEFISDNNTDNKKTISNISPKNISKKENINKKKEKKLPIETDENDNIKENKISAFGIQIGSFRNKENMLKLSEKIKSEFDESVYVQKIFLNQTMFYRVIIGEFNTLEDATLFYKKIEDKFSGCFTIKYSK